MIKSLLEKSLIQRGLNSVGAGTSTQSFTVPVKGMACLVVALLGDVTATSVLALKAKSGSQNDGSDAVQLTGPINGDAAVSFTAGATDADNKLMMLDIRSFNGKPYLTVSLERGTANAVIDGILVIWYDLRTGAPAMDASVLKQLIAPGG